ncbi:uncharacterized protein V1516DRAFT_664387 [Lipomyces oligophaga]|uniref:uncharacterized protein n=1 Tax=Lipomyces oligophaga TaxID=45792 RepID=UPI0034D01BCF
MGEQTWHMNGEQENRNESVMLSTKSAGNEQPPSRRPPCMRLPSWESLGSAVSSDSCESGDEEYRYQDDDATAIVQNIKPILKPVLKENQVDRMSRSREDGCWSPMPWLFDHVPDDWLLAQRQSAIKSADMPVAKIRNDDYIVQSDNIIPISMSASLLSMVPGGSDQSRRGRTVEIEDRDKIILRPRGDEDSRRADRRRSALSSPIISADLVHDGQEEDEDEEYCLYEEPEELEQEFDHRGRPVLRLLTTFTGGYDLEYLG